MQLSETMSEIKLVEASSIRQHTPGIPGVLVSADAQERWRPIPGYDGYEASTWGRIRSLDRVLELMGRWGPMQRFHHGKILRLKRKSSKGGSTYLCFYADGGSYPQVNRAVCAAFHGMPPSDKHEAAHLDGKVQNNRPENLAWKTLIENAADKVRHGTAPIGTRNACARLNEASVVDILARYAAGEKSHRLAVEYQVTPSNINTVIRGKTWVHVASDQREAARAMGRVNMLEASGRANAQRRLYAQH
jgi:hypothetical protein